MDNTFSLDCEGNLTVNSITTNVQDETSPDIDFDQIYPVGSVYISVNSTNPSTLFGGTWEAFASGKTLVGIDTQQSEFNTVQKTGGEKKHTLTIEEMPSHSHRFKAWAWGYTRASTTNYCADQSMQYDDYEDVGAHIANTDFLLASCNSLDGNGGIHDIFLLTPSQEELFYSVCTK